MTAGFVPSPNMVSKVAAADLSSSQYEGVKLNTSGQVVDCSLTADIPYGILQNTPETGEEARIAPVNGGGSSYVELGATLATGALVRIHTDGTAKADLATAYNIGVLESGGATGELGVVRLGNIVVKA